MAISSVAVVILMTIIYQS